MFIVGLTGGIATGKSTVSEILRSFGCPIIDSDKIAREEESTEKENQVLTISTLRTGKAATVLNITYFEPQTVQRVFNELFTLLVDPSLDTTFRNPETGRLKDHFFFIVDNGPAEAPSSPLVMMWLVRLAKALCLKSITQKSFAEYHSKRNPVEHVHAVHNAALSNEVFTSKGVHEKCETGGDKHYENMVHMAKEVKRCLTGCEYGRKPCTIVRGMGREKMLPFEDEDALATILAKSEQRKDEDDNEYCPNRESAWSEVAMIWNLREDFTSTYHEDYQVINNTYQEEGELTCWRDKYTFIAFNRSRLSSEELSKVSTKILQPIPDYVCWFQTRGELHYLPLDKQTAIATYQVDNTPAAFLPSMIHHLE